MHKFISGKISVCAVIAHENRSAVQQSFRKWLDAYSDSITVHPRGPVFLIPPQWCEITTESCTVTCSDKTLSHVEAHREIRHSTQPQLPKFQSLAHLGGSASDMLLIALQSTSGWKVLLMLKEKYKQTLFRFEWPKSFRAKFAKPRSFDVGIFRGANRSERRGIQSRKNVP